MIVTHLTRTYRGISNRAGAAIQVTNQPVAVNSGNQIVQSIVVNAKPSAMQRQMVATFGSVTMIGRVMIGSDLVGEGSKAMQLHLLHLHLHNRGHSHQIFYLAAQ